AAAPSPAGSGDGARPCVFLCWMTADIVPTGGSRSSRRPAASLRWPAPCHGIHRSDVPRGRQPRPRPGALRLGPVPARRAGRTAGPALAGAGAGAARGRAGAVARRARPPAPGRGPRRPRRQLEPQRRAPAGGAGARRAGGRGHRMAAPAAGGDDPGAALLHRAGGGRAGRASRRRGRGLVRTVVVRQGGGAQGARPRHRVRAREARVRPRRRALAAAGLRSRTGRAGGLASARVHARAGLPGHAGLATGFYNGAMTAPSPDPLRAALEAGLAALGSERALADPLLAYLALLQRWNATYNLTAIRDPEQMVTLHLLDSLAIVPHVAGISRLADLGTGAGLPGIPLAIARPELQVTLVESNGKKAR